VCDGCEDGYYREPLVGPNGGCVECSPKCSILQVEIRSCSTDHDRECKAKGPVTTPNLGELIYLPYETKLYPPLITIVILGSFNIMILSMVCRLRNQILLFDTLIWSMSLTDVLVADLI